MVEIPEATPDDMARPLEAEYRYAVYHKNPEAVRGLIRRVVTAEAESARLRSLLAGLAHDDGDTKMTGEYVARRFQEIRAELAECREVKRLLAVENADLRAELSALRSPTVSGALPSINSRQGDRRVQATGELPDLHNQGF